MDPRELGGMIGIHIKDILLVLFGLWVGWKLIYKNKKLKVIDD